MILSVIPGKTGNNRYSGSRTYAVQRLFRSASILLAFFNSEQDVKPTARFANALQKCTIITVGTAIPPRAISFGPIHRVATLPKL